VKNVFLHRVNFSFVLYSLFFSRTLTSGRQDEFQFLNSFQTAAAKEGDEKIKKHRLNAREASQ
jgi:hypothetical protein